MGDTVRLDSHAATTLRYIRSSMEGAMLLAVPGSAGIVLGSIALAAAGLCLAPELRKYWLGIWLSAALLGAVLGSVLIVRESSLRELRLLDTPLRKFALSLSPSLGCLRLVLLGPSTSTVTSRPRKAWLSSSLMAF